MLIIYIIQTILISRFLSIFRYVLIIKYICINIFTFIQILVSFSLSCKNTKDNLKKKSLQIARKEI